eukprot:gene30937-38237_t
MAAQSVLLNLKQMRVQFVNLLNSHKEALSLTEMSDILENVVSAGGIDIPKGRQRVCDHCSHYEELCYSCESSLPVAVSVKASIVEEIVPIETANLNEQTSSDVAIDDVEVQQLGDEQNQIETHFVTESVDLDVCVEGEEVVTIGSGERADVGHASENPDENEPDTVPFSSLQSPIKVTLRQVLSVPLRSALSSQSRFDVSPLPVKSHTSSAKMEFMSPDTKSIHTARVIGVENAQYAKSFTSRDAQKSTHKRGIQFNSPANVKIKNPVALCIEESRGESRSRAIQFAEDNINDEAKTLAAKVMGFMARNQQHEAPNVPGLHQIPPRLVDASQIGPVYEQIATILEEMRALPGVNLQYVIKMERVALLLISVAIVGASLETLQVDNTVTFDAPPIPPHVDLDYSAFNLNREKYESRVLEGYAFGGDRVGLLTGDISINKRAPIMVMTTEVFRNMIYGQDSETQLSDLFLVCFDEFHFMNDPERGTVWEESIISCPKDVRILALSATMGN